jgi:hypothetical protein
MKKNIANLIHILCVFKSLQELYNGYNEPSGKRDQVNTALWLFILKTSACSLVENDTQLSNYIQLFGICYTLIVAMKKTYSTNKPQEINPMVIISIITLLI